MKKQDLSLIIKTPSVTNTLTKTQKELMRQLEPLKGQKKI